jgi:hypothetical protein
LAPRTPGADWPTDFHADLIRRSLLPNVVGCPGAPAGDCTPEVKPLSGWWVRNEADVTELLKAVNASPQHFVKDMTKAGFVFGPLDPDWHPGDMYLWLLPYHDLANVYFGVGADRDDGIDHKSWPRGILAENQGIDVSSHAGDHGMLLFARDVSPDEAKNYWYLPTA